jgi:AraC-like DNA-binding protein
MVLSIIEVKKYRIKIRNFYSSIEKINYYWLTIVLYGFFFMWIVDFSHFLILRVFKLPLIVNQSLGTLSLTINFIFAVLIFYEGLKRPQYFHLIEIKEEKPREKYEKSRLSKNDAYDYLAKLKTFMMEEKPFLNPEITINELSEKVNIPPRYLSQVINDSLNKNFYDFINSYRIEEAKENLINSHYAKKTILEILYDAGFNSKSTFNKVFKDYTGLTPTEFRRQNDIYLKNLPTAR